MILRKKHSVLISRTVIVLFVGIVCAGCSKPANNQRSQNTAVPDNVRSSKDVVKVSASNISIPAGGSGEAFVTLSISPGYHINANPPTYPYLIATEVRPVPYPDNPIAEIGKPVYPSPVTRKFAFAEAPLAVYEGDVTIELSLRLPQPSDHVYARPIAGAHLSQPIDVRVQACDQEKCFPPDTLHTTLAVEVK